MESGIAQTCTRLGNKSGGRTVIHAPHDLRPHPAYARHRVTVPTAKLSELRQQGELAFAEPLTITQDRFIVDGYARWELAKEKGNLQLVCVEYELSEAEALRFFLQRHCRSIGLNAFTRIILALELEPLFKEKARSNQQAGGLQKGSSKLTKAEQVHVRSELARAAVVSVGNISKVKQLLENVEPEILEALYDREVSIHWAWKLRKAASEDQLDALGQLRFRKGLMAEIRQRASRRRGRPVPPRTKASDIVIRLNQLKENELHCITVSIVKGTGMELFVTPALAQLIGLEQTRWNQSVSCKISGEKRDIFGTAMESDRQYGTI